jgi:hypothetical protein
MSAQPSLASQNGSPPLWFLETMPQMTSTVVIALAAAPLLLYVVGRVLFPQVDSREPPILRPKIPFFGHILSFARQNNRYYERLK